ncbi:hypothetical protein [Streptomyces sulphureus]|uniref:hypothetical protein n=1 Tax=Streptomyces sulphureus TaxID=47758 RepID=UPI00036C0CD7|nr:hypothetical protein [Streptomyces sulphureus]
MAWWKLHKRDKPGEPEGAGGAVLASAALVSRDQVRTVVGKREDWQTEGWDFYRAVPELRAGVSWAANGCSRARLYIGRIDPDGSSEPIPVEAEGDDEISADQAAALLAPLQELAGGQLGQSEMLRRLSVLLDIPGESYLLGYDDPTSGERRWLVCSPSEVTSAAGGATIRVQLPDSPTARVELSLEECTLIRLWRPDAEVAHRPDSPIQALRDPLRELQGLSAHVLATVESRLAGAGLMLLSDDVAPATPQQSDGPNPLHANPVASALLESMATPLKNRDSAAAIVPLLLTTPGSPKDKLVYESFATELDANVLPLREAAIKRVGIGLDVPPETLTGMADSNHWSAWLTDETGIKMHIEPKLGLIAEALTERYFRPAWEALGVPDPENWCCWYDTSELRQRPNRSPEAAEAHSRGVLSDAAYLRELGFSTEDMPDDDEQRRRLLLQLATSSPQLAPAALEELGVPLPDAQQAAATDADRAPVSIARPRESSEEEPPRNGPPELTASAAAAAEDWRVSCLDMAVRRALERAGQWLLNRGGRSLRGQYRDVRLHQIHVHLGVQAEQLDQMLHGAYQLLYDTIPGDACLHRVVDDYVRALLVTGEEHRREYLARALAQAQCEGQVA